jgi:hypothetical protein
MRSERGARGRGEEVGGSVLFKERVVGRGGRGGGGEMEMGVTYRRRGVG